MGAVPKPARLSVDRVAPAPSVGPSSGGFVVPRPSAASTALSVASVASVPATRRRSVALVVAPVAPAVCGSSHALLPFAECLPVARRTFWLRRLALSRAAAASSSLQRCLIPQLASWLSIRLVAPTPVYYLAEAMEKGLYVTDLTDAQWFDVGASLTGRMQDGVGHFLFPDLGSLRLQRYCTSTADRAPSAPPLTPSVTERPQQRTV